MRWFGSNKDSGTERSPGQSLKLPMIIARNIKAVSDLDGAHFVFLLTFNDGEQVVLKAETGITDKSAQSHDLGVKIMGFVSAVKAKALTEGERLQVGMIDTGISRDFFRAEQFVRKGEGNWVKAAFQSNLASLKGNAQILTKQEDGFEAVDPQKLAKAKGEMIKLSQELKGNKKAWQSLGEVVAVDMMISNTDRINLGYGQFVNLGNVIFRRSGKKIIGAVGLDTFDPSQAKTTGDFSATDISQWQNEFGVYLKDMGEARKQLTACMNHGIKDINKIFGVGTCNWGGKETAAFIEGYMSGVETLKRKMKAQAPKLMKLGSAGPKGMLLRLNWLGWL